MSNTVQLGDDVQGEIERDAGPDSYPAGGANISTNLGRVDRVEADINNPAYALTAYPDSANPTEFTFELHNVADGTEVTDATDISGDVISYTAYRQ